MAPSILDTEIRVIESNTQQIETWLSSEQKEQAQHTALQLALWVASGDYETALQEGLMESLFSGISDEVDCSGLAAHILQNCERYIDVENKNEAAWRQAACLFQACALLNYFAQINWTGPKGQRYVKEIFPESLQNSYERWNRDALQALQCDGEYCYGMVDEPILLVLAKTLLNYGEKAFTATKTVHWWSARAQGLHQQLLSNPVAALHNGIVSSMEQVTGQGAMAELSDSERKKLQARAHLETALLMAECNNSKAAQTHTEEAQQLAGLEMQLTGALGKRTKFQSENVAQLVLAAHSNTAEHRDQDVSPASKPLDMRLNDDALLEQIDFAGNVSGQDDLTLLDQCIILASCLNIKNSNPRHGLTTEQMMPFVTRVLKKNATHNWLVYSMALLLRSRLEAEHSRSAERAVMQLQVLLDQYNDESGRKEAPVKERMMYFYSLAFPSVFNLQRELGQRYLSLGIAKSALELFERLEMWDEVIHCLQVIGDTKKALEACQRELDKNTTPQLLCVLGDLTKDKQHYIEAWELSGNRFARAMRSLGSEYFKENKYAECVEALGHALDINPLMEDVWFLRGTAALRLADYKTASQCFLRVVGLSDDNGEAWSNLGTCYLQLGLKPKAAHAFQQAVRSCYDSWQIWENYMHVCVDLKLLTPAVQAIHRVMDTKPDKFTDVQLLKVMTVYVIDACEAMDQGSEREHLIKSWQDTLGRASVTRGISADIWIVLASWHDWLGHHDKAQDSLQHAYRAAQKYGWQNSVEGFTTVAARAIALAESYLQANTTKSAHDARLLLQSLVKKTEELYGETTEHETLRQLLQQAIEQEKNLNGQQ